MAATEEKTYSDVLTIAHNGNLSNGRMFPDCRSLREEDRQGLLRDKGQVGTPHEVTQTKGTGEAHPVLSPNDEFANFEIWDKGNLEGTAAKTPEMLPLEYALRAQRMASCSKASSASIPTSSA